MPLRKAPRKRFKTEQEILAKIDACHSKAIQLGLSADGKELAAKELIRAAPLEKDEGLANGMAIRAKAMLKEAEKLRKQSASLIDVRSKKLGQKLSEFRTGLMIAGGGDESVPQ